DRHVDANHAHGHLALKAAGRSPVVREDRGSVSVLAAVDEREALLVGLHAHDREHGAEDLVGVDVGARWHLVAESRAEPETVGSAIHFHASSVNDDLAAVRDRDIDVAGNLVAVLPGDEGAHVAATRAIADREP